LAPVAAAARDVQIWSIEPAMAAIDRREVSVILERKPSGHPWLDEEWRVAGISHDIGSPGGWTLLYASESIRRFLSEPFPIQLHGTETEAYLFNLASARPSVFVLLDALDISPASEQVVPFTVKAVSVNPYEAQDYADSADDLLHRVELEGDLRAWVAKFTDKHHVESKFVKRKRQPVRPELHTFGQEPVHELHKRMRRKNGETH